MDGASCFLDAFRDTPGVFKQGAAGISQNDASPAAMEQTGTGGRLESKHLPAHSRFVTTEFQGRAGNAATICYPCETLQII
jgi:hypothetical protein